MHYGRRDDGNRKLSLATNLAYRFETENSGEIEPPRRLGLSLVISAGMATVDSIV